jgi:hypothetical protein
MILCAAPDAGGNFASGILMENGIDPIEKSIDLRYGGNTEEISGTQIVLNNTGDYAAAGDTLSKYFYDEGIKIQGCKCDIFEFSIIDATYVYNLLFSGICQNPTWNETEYIIPIEPHVNETSVSSVIDSVTYPYAPDDSIGKLVPVVFGNVENARGILTANGKETGAVIVSPVFATPPNFAFIDDKMYLGDGTAHYRGINSFISGDQLKIIAQNGLNYDNTVYINEFSARMAKSTVWYVGDRTVYSGWRLLYAHESFTVVFDDDENPLNVQITSGDGIDQVRRIKSITVDDVNSATDSSTLVITIYDVFSDDINVVAGTNSWCKIYRSKNGWRRLFLKAMRISLCVPDCSISCSFRG